MTDLTNVPVRNINDLEIAEGIPIDASILDDVKIPVGGLSYITRGEALSLKQLRQVLVASMPGWTPETVGDLIDRSEEEIKKLLDKYTDSISDVSAVLDAIQGQINESHLSLELNKKIDIGTIAEGTATRAQEAANKAYQQALDAAAAAEREGAAAVTYAKEQADAAAALALAEGLKATEYAAEQLALAQQQAQTLFTESTQNAQALVNQAKLDAQALVTALNQQMQTLSQNINDEISGLNTGLTQETTTRQEGDALITQALNAYKAVVNDNLAAIVSKNETIVSDAQALAQQVNALKSQVSIAEGEITKKLDATVIQNYYTKTQSDASAQTVAAGEVNKYDASLVIGGVNQLLNSEAERVGNDEYLLYEKSAHLRQFYEDNLGKPITVSCEMMVPVAGAVKIYSSNNSAHTFNTTTPSLAANVWTKVSVTVTPVRKSDFSTQSASTLEFFGTYNTGRKVNVRKVQLEAGTKATGWSPSPRDTQAALDANATAIQTTNAEVTRVKGDVTSQGQSLVTLQNNINSTNAEVIKKADATVLDGVTTRVSQTEAGLTSVGNRTTSLENTINHATTGLSTKASTTALNNTNTNLSNLDGKVTGHATQLSNLASSIQTINGTLNNKLDASIIANYYTKAQSDASAQTIAAGEVNKYDASLVIGGTNLQPGTQAGGWVSYNGQTFTEIDGPLRTKIARVVTTANGSRGIAAKAGNVATLKKGKKYILSFYARGNAPLNYVYLMSAAANGTNITTDAIDASKYNETTFTKLEFLFTAPADRTTASVMISTNGSPTGAWFEVGEVMLQEGTKSTDWEPSYLDTQSSLDANATAIQNTNAEVTRVKGDVVAQGQSITGLQSGLASTNAEVTKKANSTVVDGISNRVTQTEAGLTSVGNRTTLLENSVNHATNGLSTKASTTALNTLDGKVTTVDGKVTTATNNITNLTGRMSAVEGTVATKADASALNNIYTKTETDAKAKQIAAGEVSSFTSSLVIGSKNYAHDFQNGYYFSGYSGAKTEVENDLSKGLLPLTKPINNPFKIKITGGTSSLKTTPQIVLNYNVKATLSFKIKNVGTDAFALNFNGFVPYTYHKGKGTVLPGEEFEVVIFGQMRDNYDWMQFQIYTLNGVTTAYTDLTMVIADVMFSEGHAHVAWVEPSKTLVDSINANANAIQTTNSEVTKVDGKVKANSDAITTLNSSVGTINNALTTKLDSSVINNYYTKTQTDAKALSTAAGEVSKYDASLVIGGSNLLLNSNFEGPASTDNWSSNGGGYTKVTDSVYGSVVQTILPNGLLHAWLTLENGVEYTYSMLIKPTTAIEQTTGSPLHYHAGLNKVHQNKIQVLATSHGVIPANVWTRVWLRFKLTGDANSFRPFFYGGPTNTVQIAWSKLEIGNKATDWSPSAADTQGKLDANASAITSTNAEVSRVNGVVVSQGGQITALNNSVSNINGNLATKADSSAVNTLTNRVGTVEGGLATQAQNTTALEANLSSIGDIAALIADSKLVHWDTSFDKGMNSVGSYDNASSGLNKVERVARSADNPTTSSSQLNVTVSAKATPGYGGMYQYIQARANAVFIIRYLLKLPAGYRLVTATNSLGTGGSDRFIGNTEGTGRYETYVRIIKCGATGSFSSSGHVYVSGSALTGTQTMTFPVAKIEAYDATDYSVAHPDVLNGLSANANAISTTSAEVSRINGVVVAQGNQISALNSSIAGKADTTALNALSTRVVDAEGKLSSQAGSITALNSSLDAVDKKADKALPRITSIGNLKSFKDVLKYYYSTAGYSGNIVIQTPITFTSKMFRINIRGYNYATSNATIEIAAAGYAYTGTSVLEHNVSNLGSMPIRVRYGVRNGCLCLILNPYSVANFAYPQFTVDADIGYTAAPDSWQDGWSAFLSTDAALATNGISAIMTPSNYDVQELTAANASAVQTLDTEVKRVNGVVVSQAQSILTLTSDNAANKNALIIQGKVIDGVKASYMVKMETNGVLAGFGLIQESGAMGTVVSSFGVNANNFFIGAPGSNKKPFIVTTTTTTINGVSYPAGTWIDVALIANASIGTAKIADLAVTAAKIANATITAAEIANATITGAKIANATINTAQITDAAITTAKIGDLQVNTLKIKDNAVSTMRQYTLTRTDAVNGTSYSNDVPIIVNIAESVPIAADIIVQATVTPYGAIPSNAAISCELRFAGNTLDEVETTGTLAGGVQVLQGLLNKPTNTKNYTDYLQLHIRLTNFGINSAGKRGFKVNYNVWIMYK